MSTDLKPEPAGEPKGPDRTPPTAVAADDELPDAHERVAGHVRSVAQGREHTEPAPMRDYKQKAIADFRESAGLILNNCSNERLLYLAIERFNEQSTRADRLEETRARYRDKLAALRTIADALARTATHNGPIRRDFCLCCGADDRGDFNHDDDCPVRQLAEMTR